MGALASVYTNPAHADALSGQARRGFGVGVDSSRCDATLLPDSHMLQMFPTEP
jgi:hypothetical protein